MIQLEFPILRPPRLLTKPVKGAPCNGCGQCCSEQLCPIATMLLGDDAPAPCRFLCWRDGRFWCEVAVNEAHLHAAGLLPERLIAEALGVGRGCSSPDPAGMQVRATVIPPVRRPQRRGVIERGVHALTLACTWEVTVEVPAYPTDVRRRTRWQPMI